MRHLILAVLVLGLLAPTSVVAQTLPDAAQQSVENGLLPAIVFDGQVETWTLEARMVRWATPGVSVAVVDDGEIVWARGYGTLGVDGHDLVTTTTRFQAASISKPIAAAAAMSLVQDGTLDLDGDVNASLRQWMLPPSPFTALRPVTLKDLLSHTGGTTVHGFPGYAQGRAVPTLVDILNGSSPANSAAVVSERMPGEAWKYSGGGYQIVQQLIQDVTGRPFPEVVAERILGPAAMSDSGYARPARGDFALGHGLDGRPIPGGSHVYPEQAAAGLWTTAGDLARFGLELTHAYHGQSTAMLDRATATAMMTPVMGGYGLGPGIAGEGPTLALSHSGANEGYRAFWVIHPNTGDGVAIMTNSELGGTLAMEIARAVARVYGWPDYAPTTQASFALDQGVLAQRAGVWVTDWEGQRIAFTARLNGDRLILETFRGAFPLTPTTETTMTAAETGAVASFDAAEDGTVILRVFGLELTRQTSP